MGKKEVREFKDNLAAIQFMTIDFLENIMLYSDNPGKMGEYLTQQIRELIGARIVILLESKSEIINSKHRVISVLPARDEKIALTQDIQKLATYCYNNPKAAAWQKGESTKEVEEILSSLGYQSCITVPLKIGNEVVGVLVVLELLDNFTMKKVVQILEPLSGVAALILRNALLYETQEAAIEERTHQLSIRNQITNIFLTIPDSEMYAEVLKIILDIMRSKYGVFGYINQSGDLIVPSLSKTINDKSHAEESPFTFNHENWGDASWARAIREKKVVYSNSLSNHLLKDHIIINRHVSYPIFHQNTVIGLVIVANKETDYTDEDLDLLKIVTNHIAPILNARLQRDRSENERRQADDKVRKQLDELERSRRALLGILEDTRRIEVSLRKEEKLMRTIAENFPNSYLSIIEKDLTVSFISGQELQKQGSLPEAYIGLTIEKIFGENAGIVKQYCLDTFNGKETCFELFRDKQYQLYRTVPLADDSGEIQRILVVIENITERKKAEDLLKASEEKYRAVADYTYDWETWIDAEGNLIYVSPACERITGYSAKEFMDNSNLFNKIVFHEDSDSLAQHMNISEKDELVYQKEFRINTKSGEVRWIEHICQSIFNSDGKWIGRRASNRDITERKRAEESIRESETKLRVMFENSRDAIGVSKKGVHVFANPAYIKLFGYERLDELVGMPLLDCIAPSHHQQIIENLKRRASGEETPSFYETRGRRTDGSEFDFEINVSTYELNGEVYTLANIRDITSRKLLEKALLFVAERGWQTGEENFFDSLAQFLGENLDMDYVVIDKLDDNPEIAETIALYAKGSIVPNIRYTLKGTPCENVMGRQLCFYPKEVQKLFPEDKLLFDMGVDSYIGIPLWDSSGNPIGLIALMSSKPQPKDSIAIQVLQLVATRAAAELERERSDRILRKREYEFRTLAESLPDNVVRYNREGRTIYVNPIIEKTLATGAANMLGTTIRELNPDGSFESYAQAVDNALASGENTELEILVPNPNNELMVHQIRIIVERDEQNNVNGILAIGRDITERKRAEEALNKERNLLRTVIDNLPDGIWTKDLNCKKTLANLANVYMTGLESENEVLGKDDFELFPKEDAERFMIDDRTVIETGNPVINKEEYVIAKNGQKHFLLTTKLPFIGEQGKIIGLIGISRDITERKIAEEAIKKSEAQLNEAQRIAQIGSWELDIVNNILKWSNEIFRIFEIDPKEFGASYEAFLNAIHPEDREAVNKAYLNSLETHIPYIIDHRLMLGDGRIKYVHEQCETVFDVDGKPLRSMGTVQDITEQKQAEEALKESEEKYRTLIQKIQTAVIVHAPDTQILICNDTAEKLLGLSEEQLLGKKAIDPNWHFYREDGTVLPLEEYPVNLVLASRSELRNYVVGVHRPNSDEDVWVLVNADPVWGNENELTQVIITFNDITNRKNAEVALKLSEVRYRTLVEHAMDGIFIADQNGYYMDVNQAGCQMLGYTHDQILKLNMSDLIRKEELQTAPIQFEKLRSGRTALAERNLIHSNGTFVPVEISGIMLPDKRYLGIVRDITERKKNEAALNERIKHSQSLLRLSKNLELAQTYSQALTAALNEVKNILGYNTVWVYLLSEDKKYFKALVASGDFEDVVMSPEGTLLLPIEGDRMLEEIAGAKDIIIVEDARVDERTNKKIVESLGNRTIINVPIYLLDKHLGTVGTGTFAPEGIRVPTHSEKEFLLAMASHLAVTLDRLHLLVKRQEAEKALIRLNRELRAISNCNQSLLRAEDEQSLLNEICNLICNEAGYKLAWVGYAENDTAKTIRHVAWAGSNSGYIDEAKLSWSDETERGRGPAGITIRTGKMVCADDFETDQRMIPWRETALQHGFRSGIALPLKDSNEQPFGVLLIYSSEPNILNTDEIRLMDELANDLAFGIITIRTRAERKLVEKELELHRDHLQELVKVRTEELDKVNKKLVVEFEKEKEFERMLQLSLEKEKELSELKSRFISTTSHEFRTPLTTVRVSAEMIQRYRNRWSEDKLDEYLDKIKKSVDYLTKLLDDVLTISRSESGKISLNKETIDFHSFCNDVIEEAKISITEKHNLVFKYALKEVMYNLDPKLMNFILLNLLSNAIKYSPNGGKIELTIKQARNKLVIVVKDQGIGVPSDELKHLFEPFHRAKNTTDISGTGLGLSIVKRAVELHGGIITVKSQLGTGTTFTVNIPLNA